MLLLFQLQVSLVSHIHVQNQNHRTFHYGIHPWAKEDALGCNRSGVRRQESRNLEPILQPSPVGVDQCLSESQQSTMIGPKSKPSWNESSQEGVKVGNEGGEGCTFEIHTLLMGCPTVVKEPEKFKILWLLLVWFVLAVSQVNSLNN